jgi:hypothetical protein
MRSSLLFLAALAAMWMMVFGALMVVCGLLPAGPWDVMSAARGTGWVILAAMIAFDQLPAQDE